MMKKMKMMNLLRMKSLTSKLIFKFEFIWPYALHVAFVFLSYYYSIEDLHYKTEYTGFIPFALVSLIYLAFFLYFPQRNISTKSIIFLGLLYIGSPPLFENDQFRYIWEGKVIANGENPYKHAPNSKQLEHIEFEKKSFIAYNKLTSIYPPLAQAFFMLASPFSYKVGLIVLQILCLFLLLVFLDKTDLINSKYLILLLPYLFKEFVQGIHIDIFAVTILVIMIKMNKRDVGIFIAYLVKFLSFVCLPFLVISELPSKKLKSFSLTTAGTVFLGLTFLFYPSGSSQVSGAEAFVTFWQWNSFTATSLSYLLPESVNLRILLPALFVLFYTYLIIQFLFKRPKEYDLYVSTAYLFMLFFSPVLHPWYSIWALAFSKSNKLVFYFVFSTFMAYSSYGAPELNTLVELIQWCLLALAICLNVKEITKKQQLTNT